MNTALVHPQNAQKAYSLQDRLDTWEDHVAVYLQLEEGSSAFAWLKADTLVHLVEKFGEGSLEKFADQVNQKRSTVVNYIRTAKAFPQSKRIPEISFSTHFVASYADSYDREKKEFLSNKRFEWVEKAADENMSTRRLGEAIKVEKKTEAGADPETALQEVDASTKIEAIKQHLDIVFIRISGGDKIAYQEIVNLYGQVFKKGIS